MSKRLYRSNRLNVIAGVCGGLAEYLNMDVSIIRLIWALTVFLGGTGLLVYIIAAIVIPKEESREDANGTVVIDEDGNETFVSHERGGNEGDSNVKNNSLLVVGGAMIVIGGLILLDKFYPYRMLFRQLRGYGWPLLLIIIGVVILFSSLKRKES